MFAFWRSGVRLEKSSDEEDVDTDALLLEEDLDDDDERSLSSDDEMSLDDSTLSPMKISQDRADLLLEGLRLSSLAGRASSRHRRS